jgi:hypothetical protein
MFVQEYDPYCLRDKARKMKTYRRGYGIAYSACIILFMISSAGDDPAGLRWVMTLFALFLFSTQLFGSPLPEKTSSEIVPSTHND